MKKVNIVIPMAGLGSRFVQAGYSKPKPFIDVFGKPMIVRVLENLNFIGANFILIGRKEHARAEYEVIRQIEKEFSVQFIWIDKITEGTVCTVLFSRKFINNDIPLIIANSDQIVDFDVKMFIKDCLERNLEGSILVFSDIEKNPKWSFAELDKNKLVSRVREKEVISDFATVGIYLFSKGSSFVNGSVDMIIENDRVNNEFYTCPVYNYLIRDKMAIGVYELPPTAMNGLGTPDDLQKYVEKNS